MTTAVSLKPSIQSWTGLVFGLCCMALSLHAFVNQGSAAHLISAAGFACWSYAWSQLDLHWRKPLRALLSTATLPPVAAMASVAGLTLTSLSVVLRWLA